MKEYFDEKTIKYYEHNAHEFYETTATVEFSGNQDRFLGYLRPGGLILDLGCGSGRDSKYFLSKSYQVEAADGSKQMCELAAKLTGLPVRQMYFNDLDAFEKYDGVWACSSILHLDYRQLQDVFGKIAKSLKSAGVFYTSFKYGDFQGERNGRYFTDLTEKRLEQIVEETNVFLLVEVWISNDVRPGRSDEKWLNAIMKKKSL